MFENTANVNAANINNTEKKEEGVMRKFWNMIKQELSMKNVAGFIMAIPGLAGIIMSIVGTLVLAVPAILSNVLGHWFGRKVSLACQVLLGVGAIVAGIFGSWIICGWLALNALAVG